VVVTPEAISCKHPCKLDQLMTKLRAMPKDMALIILNLLQPQELWEYAITDDQMNQLEEAAAQAGVPILKFIRQEVSEKREGWVARELKLGQSYNMINTYEIDGEPRLLTGNGVMTVALWGCGKGDLWCNNVLEKWSKKGDDFVNNMYKQGLEQHPWECPLCGGSGKRINGFYGQCTNLDCQIISTEDSIQDVRMGPRIKRKVETLILGAQSANSTLGPTRCFFTDGSGIVVSKKMGAMVTGWAAVEVKLTTGTMRGMRVKHKWGAVSDSFQSVQWCEAKAICGLMKQQRG